jgi:two-component system, LytTR family, response regulator
VRALLVDDEQPARERLRRLLHAHPEVEIAGEAEDGVQALERIAELQPDLVFLDVQMPGSTGLEVAAALAAPRPKIVFCTAFDEYAVDAFELHAVDYLLKPVTRARLAKAIERVLERSREEADAGIGRAGRAIAGQPPRFLARKGQRYCVVPREDVLCFLTDGGLTMLQTKDQHYWMEPSLAELEERLDPEAYFRVSRAAIVRLDAVREVVPHGANQGQVRLTNGLEIEVSRRRYPELLKKLETGTL